MAGTGDPAATTDNTQPGGGQQPAQQQPQPASEARFTQADLDRILDERLKRERAKYSDYDDLKKKAEDAEAAQKSEIEKAAERAAKAEQRLKEMERESKLHTARDTAKDAALALGFDPKRLAHVLRLIDVTEDSTADTLKAALEALAKDMPELIGKKAAPATGATNPARSDAPPNETRDQRLQRIRGGGPGFSNWLSDASVVWQPEVNSKQRT